MWLRIIRRSDKCVHEFSDTDILLKVLIIVTEQLYWIKVLCGKKIRDADKKIPDTGGLVKKTDCNDKISEIESKISSISRLATNSTWTAVKNEIPANGSLVKKQIMMQK